MYTRLSPLQVSHIAFIATLLPQRRKSGGRKNRAVDSAIEIGDGGG
jgi:hypothetical protein